MLKVTIEFTDGHKVIAIVVDANVMEGSLVLALNTEGDRVKVLPLCGGIKCIDFEEADNDAEVSYDEA